MYVCMYVCMYVYMYVCIYVCMYLCMYECMYVCMHACIFMYVCKCVCETHLLELNAPYSVFQGEVSYKYVPTLLLGTMSMIGAFAGLLLPETLGMKLPESIDDSKLLW